MVLGGQDPHQLVQHAPVPRDELPLGPSHTRAPEGVQAGAAQPTHARERPEHRLHPGAQLELALHPQRAEQRGVQVVVDPAVLVAGQQPLLPAVRGEQAGHLVLVLVGHELVQAPDRGMR